MISRTLGPEFGGAIGTLFFLANVVGSALAITGCTEGIVENFGPSGYFGGAEGMIPDGRWWRFLYCSLVNTLMLIVCLVGASLFAKTNVLILGIVIVCLMSTFVSFLIQGQMEVWVLPFWMHSNTFKVFPNFRYLFRTKIRLCKMPHIIWMAPTQAWRTLRRHWMRIFSNNMAKIIHRVAVKSHLQLSLAYCFPESPVSSRTEI